MLVLHRVRWSVRGPQSLSVVYCWPGLPCPSPTSYRTYFDVDEAGTSSLTLVDSSTLAIHSLRSPSSYCSTNLARSPHQPTTLTFHISVLTNTIDDAHSFPEIRCIHHRTSFVFAVAIAVIKRICARRVVESPLLKTATATAAPQPISR